MRLFRYLILALIVCALVMGAAAQNHTQSEPAGQPQAAGQDQSTPPPYSTAAQPSQMREWVPEGVAALGQNSASRTEFTLDHPLLVLASKLERNDEDLRKVIAGVYGVSVRSFRFPDGVSFDPVELAAISEEFRAAGWQHLVSKHNNLAGETTDLWLRLDQASIRDVAVLLVKSREVDYVSASGSVTPLDLLHLSGHFGIPKLDGGIAVPVPRR